MRSEERRALVLLGTAAIVASILAAMLTNIWAGTSKPQDFFFNLPAVGLHATFWWVTILEEALGPWLAYGLFIFFYFSSDWISFEIRDLCRQIATVFMGVYIVFIAAFVPLTYFVVVWLNNNPQQGNAFLLELIIISFLVMDWIRFSFEWDPLLPRVSRRVARLIRRTYRHFRPRVWEDGGPGDMPI